MSWLDWINRGGGELRALLTGGSRRGGRSELVGGRSLTDWESGWRRIGLLTSAHVTAPQEAIGLFRLRQGGDIVYLGRSTAAQGNCLRRTLRALVHGGARTGTALDRQLPARAHELAVEILITGSETLAAQLQGRWLQQTQPSWNQPESDRSAPRLSPSGQRLPPS
ncbi:MAG: hypothetical protein ACYDAI_08625 [Trichloromonadaceae bacterium]